MTNQLVLELSGPSTAGQSHDHQNALVDITRVACIILRSWDLSGSGEDMGVQLVRSCLGASSEL